MTRISTPDTWNSALLNLMNAQQSQSQAQTEVSTQKIATDLGGFGRQAETLTAFKSAKARVDGYVATSRSVSARLTTQDTALNQVAGAGQAARQAITDALASASGDGLMLVLQQSFQQVVDGLNTRHDGDYVFGGGRTDRAPVSATTLSDLTTAPAVDSLFQNGSLKAAARLDDSTTVQTGFLASDVGKPLFQVFQAIQAYATGSNGPFSHPLSDAQRTFLSSQLGAFDTAITGVTAAAARNGGLQKRIETHITDQKAQSDSLTQLIGDRTDIDMATALTRLTQAQQAVQASAQIVASLKNTSLLNLLPQG